MSVARLKAEDQSMTDCFPILFSGGAEKYKVVGIEMWRTHVLG